MCVCVRARARALRIASMDKIWRFTNTFIIYYYVAAQAENGLSLEDSPLSSCVGLQRAGISPFMQRLRQHTVRTLLKTSYRKMTGLINFRNLIRYNM